MSSGFTSGGSLDNPVERDEEWLTAQKELDQERARKAEIQRQQGGKSLYEMLQANKAAKQEHFEESIKLKNQFRTLDDDEIDFLDSVLAKERQQEEAIREETLQQLQSFAKAQTEEESQAKFRQSDVPQTDEIANWAVNPKRKRQDKEGLRGLKFSKTSLEQVKSASASKSLKNQESKQSVKEEPVPDLKSTVLATCSRSSIAQTAPVLKSAGLVAYASSEDSDDD